MRTPNGLPRRAARPFVATAVALAALALPAVARAQGAPAPVGPWDGSNPFNCVNQDVGQGTDFPDPDADPFCVEFDKTAQNVTGFGIADFLLKEPARVAAASSKCFYFQRDHWTGSIVQGSDPELWHWDGSYFFDRAKGVGGAHVTNFRVGGTPMDATPFVPPAYAPWVEPTGGGGAIVLLETDPDPACGALVDTPEEREKVYASEPRPKRCIAPGGHVHRRGIGAVRLGMSPRRVLRRLGPPRRREGGVARWCIEGGSFLRVAFAGRDGRGDRGAPRAAALIATTNRGHSWRRIGPGSRRSRAVHRLGLEPLFRAGGERVLGADPQRRRLLLAGARGKRLRWLGLADPRRLDGRRLRRAAG